MFSELAFYTALSFARVTRFDLASRDTIFFFFFFLVNLREAGYRV